MNELALFAGAGGGILGGLLLGWRTVCAVEFDEHARNVLIARQNDGSLGPFPIWDDVRSFDGKPWRGIVDVVSGGFPCQDISAAHTKGAKGIDGERSGLWAEMARIISEVRPRNVIVENSPMLTLRGLGRVLGDLAEMGYDASWGVLGANSAGFRHLRERIWIIADNDQGNFRYVECGNIETIKRWSERIRSKGRSKFCMANGDVAPSEWKQEGFGINTRPIFVRKHDGVSNGLDRLARCGNGQVPGVVRNAWHVLCQEIGPKKE